MYAEKARDLLKKGDFEGAAAAAQSGLDSNPDDPDLWNLRGAALRSMGLMRDAERCFAEALRLDPRDLDSS